MDLPKLRKLLSLDPNDGLSRYALGRKLWEEAGKTADEDQKWAMLQEAVGHLRFANATDPRHLATYHVLSCALMDLKLPDEARPVLKLGMARMAGVGEGMGKDLGPIMQGMLQSIGQEPVNKKDGGRAVVKVIGFGSGEWEKMVNLRHKVLRPGMDKSAAHFPGDEGASAVHVVAMDEQGAVVCCASMHPEPYKGHQAINGEEPSFRLRGMATEPAWQGSGVGARVLKLVEEACQQLRKTRLVWCNARLPAVSFYKRAGWETEGDEYFIPTAGPHYLMIKKV